MIDTHAHLDFPQFDNDRAQVIKSGFNSGLELIINIGTDLESSQRSLDLANRYENIYATVGVHPHDAKNLPSDYLNRLRKMISDDAAGRHKIIGIGEIGLDYYRDLSPRELQRKIFQEQLELAKSLKLPVVVHIRDAIVDALKILRESGLSRGVLHSFPGNADEAKAGIDMGFYISFSGPITYPRSSRPEVAASIPLRRIVAETDSPYLTPQIYRGERNKPEYVRYVIERLAIEFSPYTFEDIERITSLNARRLFNLPVNKDGRIVYKIRNSLYINLTNRCSDNCQFCFRRKIDSGFVAGHYLFLKSEPASDEVITAIEMERNFDEVVFCGLGEPTIRLKDLLEIAGAMKQPLHRHFVRLNTNGHGSLINRANIPQKLIGLVDKVSVSLNSHDAASYVRLCHPDKGEQAYEAMLTFIKECVAARIPTEASVVDLPDVDIAACRKLAMSLGATFRVRHYSADD
jgi:TatD DNase family protein